MGTEWMRRLTQGLDLAGESLPGMTVAELAGDSRVLVEGHRGVTEYDPGRVTVKVSWGALSVTGEKLELCQMSKEQLVICGRIRSVTRKKPRFSKNTKSIKKCWVVKAQRTSKRKQNASSSKNPPT